MSSERTAISVNEAWSTEDADGNVRIALASPNGDARKLIDGPAVKMTEVRIGNLHSVYVRGHFRPKKDWGKPLTTAQKTRLMRLAAEVIVGEEDPLDFQDLVDNTRALQALGHKRAALKAITLQ